MNQPNWIDFIGAIGSFLSGIGLFAAAAGLIYLARQTRAGERATTAAVYQSIVTLGNSINDMFKERPELYEQLFAGASVPMDSTMDDIERANPQRFFAAAKWLDYFETILVLWPAIPEHLHQPWREYIKSCLADSPLLKRLTLDTQWFGEDLKNLCREAWMAPQQAPNIALERQGSKRRRPSAFVVRRIGGDVG